MYDYCAAMAQVQSYDFVSILLIEAKWRIYTSVTEPLLVHMIQTKAGLMSIEFFGANCSLIWQYNHFRKRESIWKCRLQHDVHFVAASVCYCLQMFQHW